MSRSERTCPRGNPSPRVGTPRPGEGLTEPPSAVLTLDGSPVTVPRPSYGAELHHEAAQLFQDVPAPMAGQAELFNPDEDVNAGLVPTDRRT